MEDLQKLEQVSYSVCTSLKQLNESHYQKGDPEIEEQISSIQIYLRDDVPTNIMVYKELNPLAPTVTSIYFLITVSLIDQTYTCHKN